VRLYKEILAAITVAEPAKKVDPRSWVAGI
jgi:hypothetical protein